MKNAIVLSIFVAFLSLGLIVGLANADVKAGLVAHWAFDEGEGDIAYDSSGNGVDGPIGGTVLWGDGVLQGALDFDGSSTFVDINPEIIRGNFTYALWMYARNMPYTGDYRAVMHNDEWVAGSPHVHLRADTSLFNLDVNGGIAISSTTVFEADQWYHVVVTYDFAGGEVNIYVDGAWEATSTGGTAEPWFGPMTIGAWENGASRFYNGMMDDVRVYDRALTEEDVVELYGWRGGANAGQDAWVYGGDRVTLSGSAPADATSITWEQVILGSEPSVTLEATADPAIVEFDAPSLTVGTVLTFQLTVDAPSTEGETTDEVKVTVRAANAPTVPPTNLRTQPRDKGFVLFWDDLLDAEDYIVQIEVAAGFWWDLATVTGDPEVPGESYEFKSLTLGTAVTTRLVPVNMHGPGTQSDALTFMPTRNLAITAANGGTTPPTGNVYVISHYAIAGMNDGAYDDNNDSWDGNAKTDDHWGYLWDTPLYFDKMVYITGQFFSDGGWFTSLGLDYTEDGTTWLPIPGVVITPAYDLTDSPANRRDFVRYDIDFATVRGLGIRIAGTPGGMATFTSIAEMEVYGDQTQGPLIVQGVDADVPENGTATLDGSYSFSELGPVSGHTWAQVSGTPVAIADPNAPTTTFDTFPVDADEVLVFSLTATDGTSTATDSDVRITVKNILTTAVAGPDQLLPEGSPVTLDGSGSMSTSGSLTYAWTQLTGPTVTLTGADQKVCTFTAPEIWSVIKQLRFQLEVNDGVGGISQDEVNVNLTNPLFELTPVGSSYFQDLLHLGRTPSDRFLAPLAQSLDTNDYLLNWGGQANVNPMEGEEYDFTDTGIDTTSNPMVWTPEHQDNGFFAYDGRASGAFEAFGQIYHIYIFSPDERQAKVHARFDDGMRIWNNGGVAMSRDTWDTGVEQSQNFTLNEGINSMTLRVEEVGGGNLIGARITDRNDVPFTDLSYALSVPNPLPLAYAVRSLPGSYQAGGPMTVDLSVRADADNLSGSVSITEAIPAGTTVADAGGGQIIGGNLSWNLTDVSVSTISYTLNVTAGTAGGLNFSGNVNYTGVPTQGIYGDSVVYETPAAPMNVSVEMLIGGHVSWSASSQEGVVGYRVYSSVNGQPFTEIGYVTGSSYVDSFALPGSTYNYKVAAVNAEGVEGPLSPATGEKMIVMQIREAEDFNYGGGLYPGFTACPAAVEATAVDDLAAGNDFFYATDIPVGDARLDYRPNDNCGIQTALLDGTTDVYHTFVGWTTVGDWWRYTFVVPDAGWIKLVFQVACANGGTIAAYWDETLVGTASYNTGSWYTLTDAVIEEQIQTTAGAHTLRVELVSGELNLNQVGLGTGWDPPKRGVIWEDHFETYANLYAYADLVGANWTVVNGGGDANGAWRLWNTLGDSLNNESPDIGGMTDNYVITDSDMAPTAAMDEELITPPIDCTDYVKVRLDFNKNYRAYMDDTINAQIAEVDIRSSDDGIVWGSWVNLFHYDSSTVDGTADPAEDVAPEQVMISQYADGRQIQVRFHFFEAEYDYWFAADDVVVTGELGEEPAVPPAVIGPDGSLSWSPFGGGNYTVQYTDDLPGGLWNNVPGTWPITATTWPGENISGLPNRYYRVMSE